MTGKRKRSCTEEIITRRIIQEEDNYNRYQEYQIQQNTRSRPNNSQKIQEIAEIIADHRSFTKKGLVEAIQEHFIQLKMFPGAPLQPVLPMLKCIFASRVS